MRWNPLMLAAATLAWCGLPGAVHAQEIPLSTTYQGQLKVNGVPANGPYDFRFRLVTDVLELTPPPPQCSRGVSVVNGFFSTTFAFPSGVFVDETFQLTVSIKPFDAGEEFACAPSTADSFVRVGSPQPLTRTPSAHHAVLSEIAEALASPDGDPSPAVTVDNEGAVGIGTPAPQTALHVVHSPEAILRLDSPPGAAGLSLLSNSLGEVLIHSPAGSNDLRFSVGSQDRMAINALGNIGVGTNFPVSRVHVQNALAGAVTPATDSILTLENNGRTIISLLSPGGAEGGVAFRTPDTFRNGSVVFNPASLPGGMDFRTGGDVSRMRLSSTGDLGLDGSIALPAGRAIRADGALTLGGSNLALRLGDSTGDTVAVPGGSLFLSELALVVDRDQTLFFADNANAQSNFLRWDDATNVNCGNLVSADALFRLHISDNTATAWAFSNGTENGPDFEMILDDSGNMEIDGNFTQLGACDVAEAFLGSDELLAGTLVVFDPDQPEAVVPSTRAYQDGIVGVVSTVPGVLLGGPTVDAYPVLQEMNRQRDAARRTDRERSLLAELESMERDGRDSRDPAIASRAVEIRRALEEAELGRRFAVARKEELEQALDGWRRGNVPVALVGRVPVRVTGTVRVGDPLTSSDIPGVAMALRENGPTLGVAMSGHDGAGEGSVVALIQPGWRGLTNRDDAPTENLEELRRENEDLRRRIEALERWISGRELSRPDRTP